MYYVIKKQEGTHPIEFLGFKVPKYITNKNSDTVIFEFVVDNKTIRKWVKKEDIVLLTDDYGFYKKAMYDFTTTQQEQQKIVETAQKELSKSIETFAKVMTDQLDSFAELCNSDDVPCILNELKDKN